MPDHDQLGVIVVISGFQPNPALCLQRLGHRHFRAVDHAQAPLQAGRIPDDGFLLLSSVPYDEIGVDRAPTGR
jgi:hypothetical protein